MRRIIREHHFENDLAALIGDFAEADDFVEGAEWLLTQNPKVGLPTNEGSDVWFLPMAPIDGEQVTLYYTFDDSTVWLISIAKA